MQDLRKLQVWQRAHALLLAVYEATEPLPSDERYDLISQMRRSSASIPTNIAEDCGRDNNVELAQFLQIAMGSASELEYQRLLACDLDILPEAQYTKLQESLIVVNGQQMTGIRTLRTDN